MSNNLKIERNIKIIKLRDEVGLTFQEIADQMGVSRQMVHKVYGQTKGKMATSDDK